MAVHSLQRDATQNTTYLQENTPHLSVTKFSRLIFKKTITIQYDVETERVHSLCGRNTELFDIKVGGGSPLLEGTNRNKEN